MARLVVRRRSEFSTSVIDQVHRLRHAVFHERLRWEVESVGGREIDQYDMLNPLFGICFGSYDNVIGCWRLLPTTGPCLTKDVFRPLLHDMAVPNDPDVWEATRFALANVEGRGSSLGALRIETAKLVEGLLTTGLQMGLAKIIAISDPRFERILSRTGLRTERFGPPKTFGVCTAVGGWFWVTEENLERVRQHGMRFESALSPAAA